MLPNFGVEADQCEEFVSEKWTAKADYQDDGFEEEYVQEIINLADTYGYDAFVMNYKYTNWEHFGKVWFLKNCGENLIEASDLEHDSWGGKSAFIRKAKTCEPLPDVQVANTSEYRGFQYNVGVGLNNLHETSMNNPDVNYTVTRDYSIGHDAYISWTDFFGVWHQVLHSVLHETMSFYIPNN